MITEPWRNRVWKICRRFQWNPALSPLYSDLWHTRIEAYPEVCYKAPFGLVAKLGKLDKILTVRGDSSLHPALSTEPDYPFKRSKVSD